MAGSGQGDGVGGGYASVSGDRCSNVQFRGILDGVQERAAECVNADVLQITKQETGARKETALPHGVMRTDQYRYEVLADATCICADNYQLYLGNSCSPMPCLPMVPYAYSVRLILPGSDYDFS